MKKRNIIMDCDPGHDDAISIILAAAHPELNILGITTVSGNADLENTTINALKICDLVGLHDVPVSKGTGKPFVRLQEPAPSTSWRFWIRWARTSKTFTQLEYGTWS